MAKHKDPRSVLMGLIQYYREASEAELLELFKAEIEGEGMAKCRDAMVEAWFTSNYPNDRIPDTLTRFSAGKRAH